MPSLLLVTADGALRAELLPIVESSGWALQEQVPEPQAWSGIDAVVFDLQTPVAEAHRFIQELTAASPFMPLIFVGDEVVVAREQGEGLRYYVPPQHLSDLEHVLISLSFGFPADEREAGYVAETHTVPRVLVVDDSLQMTSLIARALRSMERYDVRVVNSGFEAVSVLPAFQPDVAIIDIVLPDMDGREICSFIRNHPDLQHTRVIGVSGYMSQERLDNDHIPMHAFIEKPFRMTTILEQVAAFLA